MFYLFPKTKTGTRALGLFCLAIISGFVASLLSGYLDNTIEYPNPLNSPMLGTVIFLTFILAGLGAITGLISLLKLKEQSIIVYLVVILGGVFSIVGLIMLIVGVVQNML